MTNTKFVNTIMTIMLCATFALCYVHQEVSIVKTSFLVNKHRRKVSSLLGQHRSLLYNLSCLESPKSIEEALCVNEIVLCMPKRENIRHMESVNLAYSENADRLKTKDSILARLLDRFSTKAEAKVVK